MSSCYWRPSSKQLVATNNLLGSLSKKSQNQISMDLTVFLFGWVEPPCQIKDLLSDCRGVTCTAGAGACLLSHIFSLCVYAVILSNMQHFINSTFAQYFTNSIMFFRPGFNVFCTRLKYQHSQICQGDAKSHLPFCFLPFAHGLHCKCDF